MVQNIHTHTQHIVLYIFVVLTCVRAQSFGSAWKFIERGIRRPSEMLLSASASRVRVLLCRHTTPHHVYNLILTGKYLNLCVFFYCHMRLDRFVWFCQNIPARWKSFRGMNAHKLQIKRSIYLFYIREKIAIILHSASLGTRFAGFLALFFV